MTNTVTSAGGVVFFKDTMLMLKKFNGDWVLPKGHIEAGEHRMVTALREVEEEASVSARIHEYIGEINYEYNDIFNHNTHMYKKVYWYLMSAESDYCFPQREEGFKLASYVEIDRVLAMVRYEDERRIVERAIDIYNNKYLNLLNSRSML